MSVAKRDCLNKWLLDGQSGAASVHPPACVWQVASRAFLRRKCWCTKNFLTRHRKRKTWRVASHSRREVSANFAPHRSFLKRSRGDRRLITQTPPPPLTPTRAPPSTLTPVN